jgi:flavin-binding protein dodecin
MMGNQVYQIVELVGTSADGIEEAINNAISQAAKLHGKLDWYEVLSTRGFIENNKNKYYQVHLKIGCNEY